MFLSRLVFVAILFGCSLFIVSPPAQAQSDDLEAFLELFDEDLVNQLMTSSQLDAITMETGETSPRCLPGYTPIPIEPGKHACVRNIPRDEMTGDRRNRIWDYRVCVPVEIETKLGKIETIVCANIRWVCPDDGCYLDISAGRLANAKCTPTIYYASEEKDKDSTTRPKHGFKCTVSSVLLENEIRQAIKYAFEPSKDSTTTLCVNVPGEFRLCIPISEIPGSIDNFPHLPGWNPKLPEDGQPDAQQPTVPTRQNGAGADSLF